MLIDAQSHVARLRARRRVAFTYAGGGGPLGLARLLNRPARARPLYEVQRGANRRPASLREARRLRRQKVAPLFEERDLAWYLAFSQDLTLPHKGGHTHGDA